MKSLGHSEDAAIQDAQENRLIELALSSRPVSPATIAGQLAGLDPDRPTFECWQALTLLEPLLDPGSVWAVRVKSLRRRSHYATAVASATAVKLSQALTTAGIGHAVFGDLAIATAYGLGPGTRPMNFLSIWTDPAAPRDQLAAALESVPDLRTPRSHGQVLRASVGGLAIGVHRGWQHDLGLQKGPLAKPATTFVESASGTYPVVAPSIEAYVAMMATRRSSASTWLFDLQAISAASRQVWSELPELATAAERSLTLHRAWGEAHARSVAPLPPEMPPDPLRARVTQLLSAPSGAARGRLVPLIGEGAAHPNHGPWPALYDAALGLARLYTGTRITRIDEGGADILAGTEPIILAANHQDHLDYDTILITTPKARRRRLRYVATEQVLATFGSGHGLVGRGRAAILRGVYTHIHRVIPIREHIRGRAAVTSMLDALTAGDTVVIFPEGVRNQSGELARLKRGVAVLARESGVPILPIRIDGTRGNLPIRHGRLVRTKPRLTVRYRLPITAAPGDSDGAVLARIAAALAAPGRETAR